jgi:AAHS family 4-hydroxybenzoate transporter-like MFS transporter
VALRWGIGYAASSVALVILLEGLFGVFIGCASSGLIAMAAIFYPISIRSTGAGWAMGIGRFGSFVGPLVVGGLVGWQWSIGSVFLAIGAPALVAAVTSAFIRKRDTGKPAANLSEPRVPGR